MECTLKIKFGELEIVQAFDSIFDLYLNGFKKIYGHLKMPEWGNGFILLGAIKVEYNYRHFLLCTKSCDMASSEKCNMNTLLSSLMVLTALSVFLPQIYSARQGVNLQTWHQPDDRRDEASSVSCGRRCCPNKVSQSCEGKRQSLRWPGAESFVFPASASDPYKALLFLTLVPCVLYNS